MQLQAQRDLDAETCEPDSVTAHILLNHLSTITSAAHMLRRGNGIGTSAVEVALDLIRDQVRDAPRALVPQPQTAGFPLRSNLARVLTPAAVVASHWARLDDEGRIELLDTIDREAATAVDQLMDVIRGQTTRIHGVVVRAFGLSTRAFSKDPHGGG